MGVAAGFVLTLDAEQGIHVFADLEPCVAVRRLEARRIDRVLRFVLRGSVPDVLRNLGTVSPEMTVIRHGWTLPPDGDRAALVSSSTIVSVGTGVSRKFRIDRRATTASETFITTTVVCAVRPSSTNVPLR